MDPNPRAIDGAASALPGDADPVASGGYEPFPSFSAWADAEFSPAIVERAETRLAEKLLSAGKDALTAAVERASRSAAVDTGAIEGLYTVDRGFTYSVATQAATWEAMVEHKGEPVRSAIEDALKAYDYVLDAATQSIPVSEMWIRELHTIICASQETYTVFTSLGKQEQPLPKGVYKTLPNSPWNPSTGRVHQYAAVWDTAPEMARFVDELRSERFLSAHPVLQASYAHYAYVCIHPFADGNGRVARALASVFLYRQPGIPLVIFADQRARYFEALEAADRKLYSGFINFVEACVVDTIGVVAAQMRPSAPSASASLAEISQYYATTSDERVYFDAAARLGKMARDEFTRQFGELQVPAQIQCRVMDTGGAPRRSEGYTPAEKESNFRVSIQAANPAPAQVSVVLGAVVGKETNAADLALVGDVPGDELEVALREIEPTATETLRLKVAGWVEGLTASYFERLREAMAAAGRRM
jgi:Fic family protein